MSGIETLVGTILEGRYQLREVASERSCSALFVADDLKLDLGVRVRVLRDPDADDSTIRKLACIRHPNVLPVLDYGRVDGHLFVVTPETLGESLDDRMDRMTEVEVLQIVRDVASALAELHAHEIVVGTLTPEAIHFERHEVGDQVRVSGFFMPTSSTSFIDPAMVEAASWVAPEQAKGQTPSAASDVYALGAIAYAALAGQPPHVGEARAVLSRKMDEAVTPLSRRAHVDLDVELLVMSTLEVEPTRRPLATQIAEDAETLAHELLSPLPLPARQRTRMPWFVLGGLVGTTAMFATTEPCTRSVPPPAIASAPAMTGTLNIASEPSGARIYLDGVMLSDWNGEPAETPFSLENLGFNQSHHVELMLAGYKKWQSNLTMDSHLDGHHIKATLSPREGLVRFKAPQGSSIYVDHVFAGQGGYLTKRLTRGEHYVEATSPDGPCTPVRIDVDPLEYRLVHLRCPDHRHGREQANLTITGDDSAQLYLDDQLIGTPPLVDYPVKTGDHLIMIKRAGETRRHYLSLSKGGSVRLHVE